MPATLDWKSFRGNGTVESAGSMTLPDWLDWKEIAEKEQYIRHMGGFSETTCYVLINSQGQSKLLDNLGPETVVPIDFKEYRRRLDVAEQEVARRCKKLGIDRTRKPRNQ